MNYNVWQNGYCTRVTHRKYFDFTSNNPCFTVRVSTHKRLSDVKKFYSKTTKLVL